MLSFLSKKNALITTLILIGLCSQYLSDFILSLFLDKSHLSDWLTFKSTFFIAINFILLGTNQAILRFDHFKIIIILKQLFPIYFFLSAIVGFTVSYCFELPIPVIILTLLFFAASTNEILYGYNQGKHELLRAQVNFSLWRILFLLSILAFILFQFNPSLTLIVSILLISITIGSLVGLKMEYERIVIQLSDTNITPEDLISLKELFKVGLLFFAFALTASSSVYLDQSITGILGYKEELSLYFVHLTILTLPITLLSRVIGFFLNSFVRKNKLTKSLVRKIILLVGLVGFGLVLVQFLIGPLLFQKLYGNKYQFQPQWLWLLLTVGLIRLLYVIPSAIVGMLGASNNLIVFLFTNVFGIVLQIIVILFAHHIQFKNIVLAVILGVILNNLFRLLGGFYQVRSFMLSKDINN